VTFDDIMRLALALVYAVLALAMIANWRNRKTGNQRARAEPEHVRTRFRTAHFAVAATSVLAATMIARWPWPALDALLVPLSRLAMPAIQGVGLVALLAGVLAILKLVRDGAVASARDGASIPPPAFASRPLYAVFFQLGVFLSMPSVFTLLCAAVGLTVAFDPRPQHAVTQRDFGVPLSSSDADARTDWQDTAPRAGGESAAE